MGTCCAVNQKKLDAKEEVLDIDRHGEDEATMNDRINKPSFGSVVQTSEIKMELKVAKKTKEEEEKEFEEKAEKMVSNVEVVEV